MGYNGGRYALLRDGELIRNEKGTDGIEGGRREAWLSRKEVGLALFLTISLFANAILGMNLLHIESSGKDTGFGMSRP